MLSLLSYEWLRRHAKFMIIVVPYMLQEIQSRTQLCYCRSLGNVGEVWYVWLEFHRVLQSWVRNCSYYIVFRKHLNTKLTIPMFFTVHPKHKSTRKQMHWFQIPIIRNQASSFNFYTNPCHVTCVFPESVSPVKWHFLYFMYFVKVYNFWEAVLENCISSFDLCRYCELMGTFRSEDGSVTHFSGKLWEYYTIYIVIIGYMSQHTGLLSPGFKLHSCKNFFFLVFSDVQRGKRAGRSE